MKITLTQKNLEKRVEKALENACAYHALGQYKNAFSDYSEAMAYLDILEDFGVYYDDDCIVNEHCHNMLEILEDNTIFTVEAILKP